MILMKFKKQHAFFISKKSMKAHHPFHSCFIIPSRFTLSHDDINWRFLPHSLSLYFIIKVYCTALYLPKWYVWYIFHGLSKSPCTKKMSFHLFQNYVHGIELREDFIIWHQKFILLLRWIPLKPSFISWFIYCKNYIYNI